MYYINDQGGAKSLSFCLETMKQWNWCIAYWIFILASYLLDLQNAIADGLNRHFCQDHKWETNNLILKHISITWGFLEIDLFAITINTKVLLERASRPISERHLPHPLIEESHLYLSSDADVPQSPSQNQAGQGQGHHNCSDLAEANWVPLSDSLHISSSTTLLTIPNLLTQDLGAHSSPQLKHTEAQGLGSRWFSGVEVTCSKDVQEILLKSR